MQLARRHQCEIVGVCSSGKALTLGAKLGDLSTGLEEAIPEFERCQDFD